MKKILSAMLIAASVVTQVAVAEDFSYDIGNGQVTVTGNKTGHVNLYLVRDGVTQSSLSDENPPIYARQFTARGDYSYVVSLSDQMTNGKYDLYVDGTKLGNIDYCNIPRANSYLNTYVHQVCQSAAALQTALENSGDNLGIVEKEKPYLAAVSAYLWDNGAKKDGKISFDDPDTTAEEADFLYYYALYKEIAVKCMMMGKTASEVDALIQENGKYLGITDLENEYNKALTASEKTRACEILSRTELKDDQFAVHFRDAKLIAKCAMAEHASILQSLLENNKSTIGLTLTSADSGVYSRMMNLCSGFYTYQDIIKAYQTAANGGSQNTTINNTHVGGSGGGGGGVPLKVYEEKENEENESTSQRFHDMGGVAWANTAVEAMVQKKILSGYEDGAFKPNNKVTRAEFSKMLALTLGLAAEDCTFKDVPKDSWYVGYVGAMEKSGYITGFDGAFMPEDELTRQDAAVILERIMKKQGATLTGMKEFDDAAQIADYAKAPVGALAADGIINGKGDNRFCPHDALTRAEAAVLIYNALINTAD